MILGSYDISLKYDHRMLHYDPTIWTNSNLDSYAFQDLCKKISCMTWKKTLLMFSNKNKELLFLQIWIEDLFSICKNINGDILLENMNRNLFFVLETWIKTLFKKYEKQLFNIFMKIKHFWLFSNIFILGNTFGCSVFKATKNAYFILPSQKIPQTFISVEGHFT